MQELNLKEEIPQVIAPRGMRRDKGVLQQAEENGVELIPNIPMNKTLAKSADWLYKIMEQFPHIIKSISEPIPIHRDDVDVNNTRNFGRKKTNKQGDKKKLCDSFNDFGFLPTEEAMIVIKRINTSLISKQSLYQPPASFHRWGGIKHTDNDGVYLCKVDSPPCHVIELHEDLTDSEQNQILSIIGEEENAQKAITPIVIQTDDDIESGLLSWMNDLRIDGRTATKKQKIDALHEELKRRVREHTKEKNLTGNIIYPIWTRYDKVRYWKTKLSNKIGLTEKPAQFRTFESANEFYDRTLVDDNIPTLWGFEIDNLNFKDNKLRPCISEKDDVLFFNLYWPKNRDDRNIRDLMDIIHKVQDEKLINTKVLLFLNAEPTSLTKDDGIIRKYVSNIQKDLDLLDGLLTENKIQVIPVGIIPGDDRHKMNKFLDYNDYI